MSTLNAETFESQDVHNRYVAWAGASLAGLLIIGLIAVGVLYGPTFRDQMRNLARESEALFPAPRLQKDPTAQLLELRAREQTWLTTYEWRDSSHQKAHIPIDRALDIAARRGLIRGSDHVQ